MGRFRLLLQKIVYTYLWNAVHVSDPEAFDLPTVQKLARICNGGCRGGFCFSAAATGAQRKSQSENEKKRNQFVHGVPPVPEFSYLLNSNRITSDVATFWKVSLSTTRRLNSISWISSIHQMNQAGEDFSHRVSAQETYCCQYCPLWDMPSCCSCA